MVLPIFVTAVLLVSLFRRVPIAEKFREGVTEGLQSLQNIFPVLLLSLSGIFMLRASGIPDAVAAWCAPLGFNESVLSLALMRPFSGAGSLALLEDILQTYGADSDTGRLAAVLMASSETTLYTVSVYLGGLTKRTGKILLCALICDAVTPFVARLILQFF